MERAIRVPDKSQRRRGARELKRFMVFVRWQYYNARKALVQPNASFLFRSSCRYTLVQHKRESRVLPSLLALILPNPKLFLLRCRLLSISAVISTLPTFNHHQNLISIFNMNSQEDTRNKFPFISSLFVSAKKFFTNANCPRQKVKRNNRAA